MNEELNAAKTLIMMTETQDERHERRERLLNVDGISLPADEESDNENSLVTQTFFEVKGNLTLIKMANFN